MTLPDTIYTNKATLMGSAYWKLNSSLGFLFGSPSEDDIFTYSDLIDGNDALMHDYITGESISAAQTASLMLYGDDTAHVWTVSQAEYEKGTWFLFGQTFLPWFPMPSDGNGEYLRRNNNAQVTSFNKLRMDVLTPTLMTVAKIGVPVAAVTLGSYYGYKKFYK